MASVPGVPSSRIPSMWKRIASRMFFSASSTELLDAFEQQLFQAKKKRRLLGAADRSRSILQRSVTAAAATTTTEVATRGAAIALLGLVDLQRATAEVLAIESLHGALCIGARHFDEAEATRASGFAIVHQRHLVDGAVGGEVGAHLVFGGVKRQISNVKFRHKTTHK
jgi:hypothetical protein